MEEENLLNIKLLAFYVISLSFSLFIMLFHYYYLLLAITNFISQYQCTQNCLATVKVYFSVNELAYQSKKTDKQGSLEMKSFHLINIDYIAI